VGSVVLAAILFGLSLAGYGYLHYRFAQIAKLVLPGLQQDAPQQPMNILLVGDNCRSCLNGKQANAFGTGAEVGGGRSDVTMILHVDPATKRVALLSIPRDLFVPIPRTNDANRVDAALDYGPERLIETIEDDLGIPINHYVELNFDTFQNVVNALGGIDMYFPVPVRDAYSGLDIKTPGCHHLNGFQALAVVRARHMYYEENGYWHYDPFGDLSRIKRDHEFLRVLAASVLHRTNPLTLNAVIGAVAPQLKVDSGFTLSTMIDLAREFRSVNPNSVPTATLPVVIDPNYYYYRGANYGDVVFPSEPEDRQVIDQMLGSSAGPAPAPDVTVPVRVLNGSGYAGAASAVASKLQALGVQIGGTGNATVVGDPAETVVYYGDPAMLPQAQRLAADLAGNVTLGFDPTLAASGLTLVVGTDVSVVTPSSPASSASPPATATLSPPTPAHTALPSFDPTACPPGSPIVP
jgi:LCP family protein required for cell wall assembly